MQTNFTQEQLKTRALSEANEVLRNCVHCGFCTATCPTYLLLGDELDSPRGRIYLIKDMLENDRPATAQVVKHVDRCLSCLSCMTTCPSGVNYMRLIDTARVHVATTYKRPLMDRLMRGLLQMVLPYPGRFRLALMAAKPFQMLAPAIVKIPGCSAIAAMLSLAPASIPPRASADEIFPHKTFTGRRGRVALLKGCAQSVLDPGINAATTRLLNRQGIDVILPKDEGCCGALVHHMGAEEKAIAQAKVNVDAWMAEVDGEGLDAIVITASGCGTTIKDYAHLLIDEPNYAEKARIISDLAKDITEYLCQFPSEGSEEKTADKGFDLKVAYHSACSMQHGQKIVSQPKELLGAAGFEVVEVPEGHICCGSAGTYNILQSEISLQLRDRKVANIQSVSPDIIATGNIGCMTQIGKGTDIPIVHTIELLDWAGGGPKPQALSGINEIST
jgi:glycolate dehydrogenase iron-sulfur subunit